MERKNLDFAEELKGLKQRFCVADIKNFLNNHREKLGEIVVLYGLRRTGKTTIMKQIVEEYKNKPEYKNRCQFLEIQTNDTMNDIYDRLKIERSKGIKLICLDEITNTEDFINNSAVLADIFAMEGMQIIIAGTDSLSFYLARKELYDREFRIRTTHIPYVEHSYVLGINDIDDYIEFGGLMKKGGDKNIIKNYDDVKRYLDEAVADNIVNSIKKDIYNDTPIKDFDKTQLRTIIAKMVELYSGKLNKKIILEKLKNVSINKSVNNLYKQKYEKEPKIQLITKSKNRNYITDNFIKLIQADTDITININKRTVKDLEEYLTKLDVLSVTNKASYSYTDEEGWETTNVSFLENNKEKKEEIKEIERENKYFYIIQPAIKYFHLQQGLKFIDENKLFKKLPPKIKIELKKNLDETIKGAMIEQIIAFDVAKVLNEIKYFKNDKKYSTFKPDFTINGKSAGEYDLLVYDNENNNYYAFEVKHTKNLIIGQDKNFRNDLVTDCINSEYGERKIAAVLYRGNPCINENGTVYFNISDFLIAVNKYKNMDLVIDNLTKDLNYRIPYFRSQIKSIKVDKNLGQNEKQQYYFEACQSYINKNPFEFIYVDKQKFNLNIDNYLKLCDIVIEKMPILLHKINFDGFENDNKAFNKYMALCDIAVNKISLTIKDINIQYYSDNQRYVNLWLNVIDKHPELIKYLKASSIKESQDYENIFFVAFKKMQDILNYIDFAKLADNYENMEELKESFYQRLNLTYDYEI